MNYITPAVKVTIVRPRAVCVSPGVGTEGFVDSDSGLDLGDDWD